jgi:phage I-like protein
MNTSLSYHMMQLPSSNGTVPDWIHVLPAGTFRGADGRGPYVLRDPAAVIAASLDQNHTRIIVDENHSTDTGAKIGLPSPAMGRVLELQSRADGIWARVKWNKRGHANMTDDAYFGISPVFASGPDGTVTRIVRVSLTNDPNLTLHHLHHRQETRMDLDQLRSLLGLPATASAEDVAACIKKCMASMNMSMHAAQIVGLDPGAGPEAVIAGVRARVEGASAHAAQVTALQAQVNALTQANAQRDAEIAVDQAARDGSIISDELRGELISLHTSNPDMAKKIIAGLTKIPQGQIVRHQHSRQVSVPGLEAEADPAAVAKMDAIMGVTADERAKLGGGNAHQ